MELLVVSVSWLVDEKMEQMISLIELTMLRLIYGVTKEEIIRNQYII